MQPIKTGAWLLHHVLCPVSDELLWALDGLVEESEC